MGTKNTYSPYGFHLSMQSVVGFNGEPLEPLTGFYHLGNGYRAYNPSVMRFNGPDSLSPFAQGGMNAYAYCQGDPVNFRDPSGHVIDKILAGLIGNLTKARAPKSIAPVVSEKLYTKRLGWHGTEASHRSSLERGLSPSFSTPDGSVHRKAQGPGFYFATTYDHAKKYADKAAGQGEVFVVLQREDVSLVPNVGYKKDDFGGVVIRQPAFEAVMVRQETPPDVVDVTLRRTPYNPKKKPPTAA